jgi:hypothetical protein
VIFGSLNLWKVSNVKVLGRGVIVYNGPQNPEDDDGWMQKPDWHCIGAWTPITFEIHGLTCLVRSRTWSIQMKDSSDFLYDDLRVIGGNPGNANQDGMDWLGGGDTIVRDSFFRASDDVLRHAGQLGRLWRTTAMVDARHDVSNITDRAQRAIHQHLQHRARGLARENLQLAQLHPARLRHSAWRHWLLRIALRALHLLGCRGRQREHTMDSPLRICGSTTGIRSFK